MFRITKRIKIRIILNNHFSYRNYVFSIPWYFPQLGNRVIVQVLLYVNHKNIDVPLFVRLIHYPYLHIYRENCHPYGIPLMKNSVVLSGLLSKLPSPVCFVIIIHIQFFTIVYVSKTAKYEMPFILPIISNTMVMKLHG